MIFHPQVECPNMRLREQRSPGCQLSSAESVITAAGRRTSLCANSTKPGAGTRPGLNTLLKDASFIHESRYTRTEAASCKSRELQKWRVTKAHVAAKSTARKVTSSFAKSGPRSREKSAAIRRPSVPFAQRSEVLPIDGDRNIVRSIPEPGFERIRYNHLEALQ